MLLQPALCCASLQNLKWLDLKDNPLDPVLAKVAGDCLDENQCKQAAVKVRSLLLFNFFFSFIALLVVLPLFTLQAGQLLREPEVFSGSKMQVHSMDFHYCCVCGEQAPG